MLPPFKAILRRKLMIKSDTTSIAFKSTLDHGEWQLLPDNSWREYWGPSDERQVRIPPPTTSLALTNVFLVRGDASSTHRVPHARLPCSKPSFQSNSAEDRAEDHRYRNRQWSLGGWSWGSLSKRIDSGRWPQPSNQRLGATELQIWRLLLLKTFCPDLMLTF